MAFLKLLRDMFIGCLSFVTLFGLFEIISVVIAIASGESPTPEALVVLLVGGAGGFLMLWRERLGIYCPLTTGGKLVMGVGGSLELLLGLYLLLRLG